MATPPTSHHHHQSPPPPPPPSRPSAGLSTAHSIPMLLPVFILFFILICFLSIFLFRDLLHYLSTTWLSRRRPPPPPAGQAADQGLDPEILASFPTLPYSAVRGLQEGKCGRECAVCLSEFDAGDAIRLLTVCCHAFHPVCIDSWLAAHTTCPLCRSDLEAPPDEAAVRAVKEAVGGRDGNHTITINDEEEEEEEEEEHAAALPKSQSIGHSGRRREEEEEERNTVRPSGNAEERTAAHHRSSASS